MASIRAQILMSFLRAMPYDGTTTDPEKRAQELARSRRVIHMMAVPHPPKTRTIPAHIPGVKAEWHVGEVIRYDARIVYFHGGGFCTGSPLSHRHFTAKLAKETGMPVLSVDYRLAPEHPYPAAQDDAVKAYAWAQENGPLGPSPVETIFVGGDSAGGGLTMSMAMRLRDEGRRMPAGLILLSPWLDLTITADSIRRIGPLDVMLNAEYSKRWVQNYAVDQDPKTPGISPLFGDFEGLPPMFFSVGGREILLDDTLSGIERAKAAGVETVLDRNEEMFHIWPVFYHLIPEGRASVAKIVQFIHEHSGAM